MNYRNAEMKIDQLVSYLNDDKINLAPPFQRGHVWSVRTRRRLLQNMVFGKPIPAIFLYKEAAGSKYSYNILDGKQRLESLILFIGCSRNDFKINNWERYFVEKTERKDGEYWIDLAGTKTKFQALADDLLRDLREYAIPTVEMTLDDETSLDEVISLFVDINQQGVPVNRFDIVKAMYKNDPILKQVFSLLAVEQRRGQDLLYKMVSNEFTFVLKRLQIVVGVPESNSKVDRMWEKLLELAVFTITKEHRKPVDILKGFITKQHAGKYQLTPAQKRTLRDVFKFIRDAYRNLVVGQSRLATDHTHFYIVVTTLISANLLVGADKQVLISKLSRIAEAMQPAANKLPGRADALLKQYLKMSEKQTTDVAKRKERVTLFSQLMDALPLQTT